MKKYILLIVIVFAFGMNANAQKSLGATLTEMSINELKINPETTTVGFQEWELIQSVKKLYWRVSIDGRTYVFSIELSPKNHFIEGTINFVEFQGDDLLLNLINRFEKIISEKNSIASS